MREGGPSDPFSPEQRALVEKLKDKISYNTDYIAPETYVELFERLKVDHKTIADVGTGFVPLGAELGSTYSQSLDGKGVNLIPIDREDLQTMSWGVIGGPREAEKQTLVSPVQADAKALPLADKSVDGCVSINLLNAQPRGYAKRMLEEMYRILKDEGFVVISTFGYNQMKMKNGEVMYNNDIPREEIITEDEMKDMARDAGFSEIENIPLDKKRMKRFLERDFSRIKQREEYKDMTSLAIAEPIGLLLRKNPEINS